MNGKPTLYMDQYGQHFHANTVKALRQQIPGRCDKMYVDQKDGGSIHIGYVIGRHWLTAFRRIERAA